MAIGGSAAPNSWILVAVSATSDPTGTWHKYAIDADLNNGVQDNNWADFPGLGLDNSNLYIRANMVGNTGGPKIWVIPKAQLLAGANPITWTEFVDPPHPPGSGGTIQPAHVYGTSSAEYLVETSYPIDKPPFQRYIRIYSITFPSGTPTWIDLGLIQVNSGNTGLFYAPQPGGSALIDTGSNALLNVVFRNGTLWTTHTVIDDTESRTEIAWYQVDPATASDTTPGVPVQQGRISHATRFYYYPSIAVNANGDVGIGFSGSSPTEYSSAYYTARAAADPPGTMQPVATLKAGLAYYSNIDGNGRNRWGDYSATCVDPTDDLTFWTLQEYANLGNAWATWWGSFSVPPSSYPTAPANLSATAISSSQINLTWTDQSANETGFQIERKTGAGGTYALIVTTAANATTYSDTGVVEGTTYFYRVRTVNGAGNSAYSNEANATLPVSPPAAPANLSATAISSSQINLTWTDQSANETGFQIERKTGAGGTYALIVTTAANATAYSDTGRAEGTTYFYRVRAVNGAGNSAYSNEASATTTVSLPAAPANLSATAISSSQINLTWTDQSANETGFQIERKIGAGGTYALIVTTAANATTYSDTGVVEGTTYFYRVRTVNGAGNSAYSNEANATLPVSPPAAPANLSATAISSSQINLTWTDQSDNEDGFRIYRGTDSSTVTTLMATLGVRITSYSNTDLAASTTYYYKVTTFNTAGESAASNVANATTEPPPVTIPSAPTNLQATAASSSVINLTWNDASGNETGFQIERKTGAGGTYALIVTTAANATTYSDTGVVEGTTYFYRVRTVNGAGNSAYSNEANATTPSSGAGSSGGGGGGGCSISLDDEKSKGESPWGTMLALFSPGIFLVARKTIHRKKILLQETGITGIL